MIIKNIVHSLRNTLKGLSWPVFALLLVVASALWFIGKLSHRYTTEISIPVEFTADYKAEVWVKRAPKNIRFLVEGEGGTIMLYKMGFGNKVMLPISAIELTSDDQDQNYIYSVGETSLVKAMSTAQTDFSIIMVTDTLPKVVVSPIESRKLPVVSRVRIICQDQYMVVGGVQIIPDSVAVKAPKVLLDTLKIIYTAALVQQDCISSQSGAVDLQIPPLIVAMQNKVRYEAVVERFTEKVYTLPIETPHQNLNSFTLPNQVQIVVRIPLTQYFTAVIPRAVLDLSGGEQYKPIYIVGLPPSAKIVRQDPDFAQFYTIEQ